jgi:hypothetical protein
MLKLLTTASLAITLAFPPLVQAADPSKGIDKAAQEQLAIARSRNAQERRDIGVPACSLCFTCGGSWPNFSGAFDAVATSQTAERGSLCSGNLTTVTDRRPFLCCTTDR